MRKNSKDYKPWDKYIEDQKNKMAYAAKVASAIQSITAQHHVDIGMVIAALQSSLVTTGHAAWRLKLSERAFLRLRRKYGLEPVSTECVPGQPKWMKYLYTEEQLTRIPQEEIERAKFRMAQAKQRINKRKSLFSPDLDFGQVARRLHAAA